MNELDKLRNDIDRADQIYFYGDGSIPGTDDDVYNAWKLRLKKLCPDDVRHTRVGAPFPAEFTGRTVRHKHPMGSLDKALNAEEFSEWVLALAKRLNVDPSTLRFSLSHKMDGGSGSIAYENGNMVLALTRGEDGIEGEDITANAIRMTGVPRYVELPGLPAPQYEIGKRPTWARVAEPFTGFVRGEFMLFNKEWLELDPDQTSNPRNLGNGISRRQDGENTEYLTFVPFRLFDAEGNAIDPKSDTANSSESAMLDCLSEMGFSPVSHKQQLSAKQVLAYYRHLQGLPANPDHDTEIGEMVAWTPRDSLPFIIDGLVVKLESLLIQSYMDTNPLVNPVTMVAIKFPPRGARTKVLSVELTLGHTGAIIPTAILEPVKIGGVTVSRALLCNWDEIRRLDVAVGDTVFATRQGDVIPKVVEVLERPEDRQPISEPLVCPVTGGPVGRKLNVDGTLTAHLFSLSPNNPGVAKGKILRWVSSLDIQGLGDVYVNALYEAGVIKNVASLYKLDDCASLMAKCGQPALGIRRARSVLAEVNKKRTLTLAEFLGSLGIAGLGKRRVEMVRAKAPGKFDTLEDWLDRPKLVGMANEIGLPRTAGRIGVEIQQTFPLIAELLEAGVSIKAAVPVPIAEPVSESSLCFCLTGTFPRPKEDYHIKLINRGHRYVESYSNKAGINYVVAADPTGTSTKLKKAREKGVPIISAEQLLEMLK